MQNLPIGIQTFSDIRENDYLYVDKTEYVYDLTHAGKFYFLSRPRRFGKSLLLSTLNAYFSGRKDLFEGLKIAKLEKEWKQYPVIRIDFSLSGYETNDKLKAILNDALIGYEKRYNVTPSETTSYDIRLKNVIIAAKEATNEKVVVLIDEYDKPILDALYTDVEDVNRAMIRSFYSVLKGCDEYLKFIFLTGITRVSHINIFSGLNQIKDISMSEKYAAICGITKNELKSKFKGWINKMAKKNEMTADECLVELKRMYDGYHFSKISPDIFNPYSLLNAFSDQDFGSYWYRSGTPTILVRALKQQTTDVSKFVDNPQVYEESFNNFRTTPDGFISLIYQSGYLTIKDYDKTSKVYTLGVPNGEVKEAFYKSLLPQFSAIADVDLGMTVDYFRHALLECDMTRLEKLIKASIANLPYLTDKSVCEDMYRNVLHMIFTLTGFRTTSESVSLCGRADTVVELSDKVYIFEYKMLLPTRMSAASATQGSESRRCSLESEPQAKAVEALTQIDDKHYADRYDMSGKRIIKTALVFDLTGLVAMKYE